MIARPLVGSLLDNTVGEWADQVNNFSHDEKMALGTFYFSKLKYMKESEHDGDLGFYGLAEQGGYARSVLELKHRQGAVAQLRVLNIHLEPRLDVEQRDGMDIREAVGLVTRTLSEALRLTFEEAPSDELKVYARNDHMKGFLETVATHLQVGTGEVPGLSIDTEGRWLVFKKS